MTSNLSSKSVNPYTILKKTQLQRVVDGSLLPILEGCESATRLLIILMPQLGDFDSLEYAWWLQKDFQKFADRGITLRAVGIGSLSSGKKFCQFTGFREEDLFVDPKAQLHSSLELYSGLSFTRNAWINLMLMCAGIGSPGTLAEVFRGYLGDRQAPQLIQDYEEIQTKILPPLKGSFFAKAGGRGFQRPFELATLRLRNMNEVLSNWKTYVPNASYLTQRGATFLFDTQGELLYEHRDKGILGFAANMSNPLSFLDKL